MDPDGGGVALEHLPNSVGAWRNQSNQRHGGDYWYLNVTGNEGTNPDGSQQNFIEAWRDDGAGGSDTIQLTTPDSGGERICCLLSARWGKDDSFVGFISIRWVAGVAEAHLYKASVTWDGVTGEPSLGTEVAVHDLSDQLFEGTGGTRDLIAHGADRAPNGDEVALSLDGDLVHVDLGGTTPVTTTLDSGILPIWSPDGTYVAYRDGASNLGGNLYVVAPDSGSPLKLVDDEDIEDFARVIDWTPDSAFVVFSHLKRRRGQLPFNSTENHDIARVSPSGGKITLVTDTKDVDEELVAWRDD